VTSKKNIETNNKVFKDKETKAAEKLKGLREQLAELIKKDKVEEEGLKKRKQQGESQLKEIIETYDISMEKKMSEKGELENDLEKIREELRNLKEHFKITEDEKRKDSEIMEKIQKKKDLLETDEDRTNQIVLAIQNAWKNFKTQKGGGKKKKKGKKGKK